MPTTVFIMGIKIQMSDLDFSVFTEYNSFTESVKDVILMKHGYTEHQYEQLAQEQICSLVKSIPFVSDVEMHIGREWDFTAVIHFDGDWQPVKLNFDVSARGERKFVERFIRWGESQNHPQCFVFAAPYITEASAVILKESGYSYMDLSGNCRISVAPLFILIQGKPNKFARHEHDRNYFNRRAAAASVLLRNLLHDYQKIWGVQELSERSGKSIGAAANMKSFLIDHGWAEASKEGFRLCHIEELLRTWAAEYHKRSDRTIRYYSLDQPAVLEQNISDWNKRHGGNAVLGGFSAAARYAPTVRYNKVCVYVAPEDLDEFQEDLGLERVESGENVSITIPHDETPCLFAHEINGYMVTSPVQTVLNLLSGAGRGEEAATAIMDKEFTEDGR